MSDLTQSNDPPLLSITGFCKRFGAVSALEDVRLEVRAGEVVALVGDNGAGKSTLVKAIAGVAPADEGAFDFDGHLVRVNTPKDASKIGIATVFQDLALCDNLDVVANLFLGREEIGGLTLNDITMEREARRLLDSLAVRTLKSVRTEVGMLSGGQRQTVAIARSMVGNPKLVILDEPTAALGVAQTEQVLNLVLRLKQNGHGVILISHNLADVFQVADRIVVLRLGRNAGEFPATADQRHAVVAAITGLSDVNEEAVA
ncbi:D-xylose transport system ATP-binding protein [Paenarthrobacter nicotinovorans]|uniref:ATP-binding cassette domain-containing protein n=1 Tax=Paenarthrobacter nicotinovorans TaxID=29320 RepID=UPI0027887591|nr:ATP-binding cassette domain-containing protein [Paenarthrobacter nicotinovorans]MDP9933810.1 D-xylose transport system ATP-binding protein [Paenarthrobacter nicotinovorans]